MCAANQPTMPIMARTIANHRAKSLSHSIGCILGACTQGYAMHYSATLAHRLHESSAIACRHTLHTNTAQAQRLSLPLCCPAWLHLLSMHVAYTHTCPLINLLPALHHQHPSMARWTFAHAMPHQNPSGTLGLLPYHAMHHQHGHMPCSTKDVPITNTPPLNAST